MVDRAVRSGDKHRENADASSVFLHASCLLVPGSRHGGTPAGHFARYLIAALVWWSTHRKVGLGRAKASFSAGAHSALALDNVCRCRSVHYPYPYQQGSKLETCLEARKHRLVRILSHTRNVIIM